ncbi:MAG TPA: hypothetical protein VN726_02340 [Hanamia sp.]|jgi:hypothetical protein|nr:hypothetical protein [Hanamia sp.]
MIKFTTEDLVRYLYNETSEQKTAMIKAALQSDWNLKETYENLVKSQKDLNEIEFSPRRESINKILDYASKRHTPVSSH